MTKDNTESAKWVMKPQTQVKHEILSFYLKAFMAILSRPSAHRQHTTLHFVDGFAGKGIYQDGEPGSPVIAMRVGQELYEHTQGRANLKVYAVEIEPANFASLQQEVAKTRPSCESVQVELYQGAFRDHVDALLARLTPGEPAFVFIDPFGYDDGVDVQTVLKLIQRPRTEVFITLMSWFINRFLSDPDKADRMTTLFGGEEWREIAAIENEKTQERLMRLYAQSVLRAAQGGGLNNVIVFPVGVKFGDKNAHVYHLIHLSQNPKARFEMERAVKRLDLLRSVSLNSLEPLFFGMQQGEIEAVVIETLKQRGEMEAITLAGELWRARWEDNLTWDNEIRSVYKNLERQGVIEITSPGKVRKPGLAVGEKDRIRLKR